MPTPDLMSQLQAHYAANPGAYPGAVPHMYGGVPGVPAAVPGWPAPVTTPAPGILTRQDVQAMIDAAVRQPAPAAPAPPSAMVQFGELFKRALPPEDFAAFAEYAADGTPGFDDLFKSDALYPIVQLLWETIKENKK